MEKCGDCKFYHWGTCYGLPPRDKFMAHGCQHLSIRPKVDEGERACSLFKKREEKL